MSTQPVEHPDPLIDEVRQRRTELYASCGNDLRRLFERIRQLEGQHPEKVVDPRRERLPRTVPREA